jgi:hypothetical protein
MISSLVLAQFSPSIFEGQVFCLEFREKAAIIRGFTHGWTFAQRFQLLTNFFHCIRYLLAQWLR